MAGTTTDTPFIYMKMPYDIPEHDLEVPQRSTPDEVEETSQEDSKSTQTETAQIYRFIGLPQDLEYSRKDCLGNYFWWPTTRADWNQRARYVCPDSVKLMLPFGPGIER